MVQGKRSTHDERVRDALDRCLTRMRRGESLERCLLDEAGLADELRPLLYALRAWQATPRASAPAPSQRLARGRDRFLAAAAALRRAEAPAAVAPATHAADDSLDACLARMLAGDTPEAAVAGAAGGELADRITPLLAVAAAVAASPPAPAPEGGLTAGRARFLAAAAGLRSAAAAPALNGNGRAVPPAMVAGGTAGEVEALDACIARLRAGERAEHVLADLPAPMADALRPLMGVAADMAAATVAPPPPPRSLVDGRARFLDVAARSRAHHAAVARARRQAADTVGRPAAVADDPAARRWLGGIAALVSRVAVASVLACAVFVVGVMAMGNSAAVANALPGEPAYYFKRLNERIDLLTTFDPQAHARLVTDLDRRRVDEADRLIALGRAAEVSFRAVWLAFDAQPGGGVLVRVPPEGGAADERWLSLGPNVALSLGDYASLAEVPAGALVTITIRTDPGAARQAVITSLNVTGAPPSAASAVAESARDRGATAATAVPRSADGAVIAGADQPETPTATEPPATDTPTVPPTTPPPATTEVPTSTPNATPGSSVVGSGEGRKAGDKLQGVVVDQPEAGIWIVGVGQCPQRLVRADVRSVDGVAGLDVRNHAVVLRGEYRDGARTEFAATKLNGRPSPVGDQTAEAAGTVADLPGDGRLVLTDGRAFLIGGARVNGTLAAGAMVTVRYRGCADGTPEALEITVQAAEQPFMAEGRVSGLVPGARFTLEIGDDGDPSTPEVVTVLIDATTQVRGAGGPASLADGQTVSVNGVVAGAGEVRATSIFVLAEPPLDEPEGGAPPATPAPTPAAGSAEPPPALQPALEPLEP